MNEWLELVETIAHLATLGALVWSILTFAADRRAQTEAREFEAFTRLLDLYERVAERRQNRWRTIKDALRQNPKTAAEVHDRQDTLSYLELRANQAEPFFAVEHGLLEDEIQSLNLLNELCRSALEHERCRRVLATATADEISYYQNKLPILVRLYEREKVQRLFSRPQHAAIEQVDIGGRFDRLSGDSRH